DGAVETADEPLVAWVPHVPGVPHAGIRDLRCALGFWCDGPLHETSRRRSARALDNRLASTSQREGAALLARIPTSAYTKHSDPRGSVLVSSVSLPQRGGRPGAPSALPHAFRAFQGRHSGHVRRC